MVLIVSLALNVWPNTGPIVALLAVSIAGLSNLFGLFLGIGGVSERGVHRVMALVGVVLHGLMLLAVAAWGILVLFAISWGHW